MNSFGHNFRISLFGESHGPAIGVVIDGLPAGISLSEEDFTNDIERRKGGISGTTSRVEADKPEDYEPLAGTPRPGHADWVAAKKFDGYNDPRGGGHFSGRLTLPLVAAGVVAKKILGSNIHIHSRIAEIGGQSDSTKWPALLEKARAEGDSLGGIVECIATGVPAGVGEPFFDSVESLVSHILFSIPGVRGVEFGDGFEAARMSGSEHNDPIISTDGLTSKNGAGGINGGITNGNPIVVRVAIKPTSSISRPQQTLNISTGHIETLTIGGRHDTCIALRAAVVAEAAVAIVLADLSSRA